jgi:hypothetical protein
MKKRYSYPDWDKSYNKKYYVKNKKEKSSKSLAYYYAHKEPKEKIKKGIAAYQLVMRDFYTKSHRLECYRQLIKEMKEQRMKKAA